MKRELERSYAKIAHYADDLAKAKEEHQKERQTMEEVTMVLN